MRCIIEYGASVIKDGVFTTEKRVLVVMSAEEWAWCVRNGAGDKLAPVPPTEAGEENGR